MKGRPANIGQQDSMMDFASTNVFGQAILQTEEETVLGGHGY